VSEPRASDASPTALPAAGFLLLAAITVFWGGNWPAMKIALTELPVWWFRSLCLLVGGGGLLVIARLSGNGLKVPRRELRPLLICAAFNVVGWQLCSAYGISLMAAGRAAIVAFTMPVWAALLSSLVLGEALTRNKIAGLLFGVGGLAVLIGPDLVILKTAPLGAFFMLLAAVSWAIGTVAIKRFSWTAPAASLVGWQLLVGAVPVTLGALLLEPMPDFSALSERALLALVYVFAFPMLFCQWAYFKTVRLFPASIAAIGTLAIPVLGVYSSALLLDEPAGLQELLALFLICAALACVLLVRGSR
jgi:drug/metabolite transporter (DMT)-like permease